MWSSSDAYFEACVDAEARARDVRHRVQSGAHRLSLFIQPMVTPIRTLPS